MPAAPSACRAASDVNASLAPGPAAEVLGGAASWRRASPLLPVICRERRPPRPSDTLDHDPQQCHPLTAAAASVRQQCPDGLSYRRFVHAILGTPLLGPSALALPLSRGARGRRPACSHASYHRMMAARLPARRRAPDSTAQPAKPQPPMATGTRAAARWHFRRVRGTPWLAALAVACLRCAHWPAHLARRLGIIRWELAPFDAREQRSPQPPTEWWDDLVVEMQPMAPGHRRVLGSHSACRATSAEQRRPETVQPGRGRDGGRRDNKVSAPTTSTTTAVHREIQAPVPAPDNAVEAATLQSAEGRCGRAPCSFSGRSRTCVPGGRDLLRRTYSLAVSLSERAMPRGLRDRQAGASAAAAATRATASPPPRCWEASWVPMS